MTLARPGFLWLLALAVPLAAAYLVKRRRQRQVVPDLEAWLAAAQATHGGTGRRQLRDAASLALLLAALAALSLAAAGPEPAARPPSDWALIFDTSASMGATDGRRARAVALAEEFVAQLPPGDRVRILEAGTTARTLGPWRLAGEPLPLPGPADDPRADLAGAVALAAEGRRAEAALRVVAFTDGPCPGAEFAPRVADATANLAVEGLSWSRAWGSPWIDVRARVVNRGAVALGSVLTFRCGGSLDIPVPPVAPGAAAEFRGRLDAPRGGACEARLRPGDGLEIDDVAYAVVPPLRLPRVLVTAPDARSPFLQAVLASVMARLDPASGVAAPGADAEAVAEGADLALWDRTGPSSPSTRPAVWIASPSGPPRVAAEAVAPQITGWAADHPLLAGLDLSRLRVARARPFLRAPGLDVLVDSSAGPLVVARADPPGPCLALAFALEDSNLPLLAAFPLLVRNALDRLAGERLLPGMTVGEAIRPFDRGEWEVDSGSGAVRGTGAWLAPRPGVFLFTQAGIRRPVAVSFLAPGESTLAEAPPGRALPALPPAPLPAWIWLAALAVLALSIEGVLARLTSPA